MLLLPPSSLTSATVLPAGISSLHLAGTCPNGVRTTVSGGRKEEERTASADMQASKRARLGMKGNGPNRSGVGCLCVSMVCERANERERAKERVCVRRGNKESA